MLALHINYPLCDLNRMLNQVLRLLPTRLKEYLRRGTITFHFLTVRCGGIQKHGLEVLVIAAVVRWVPSGERALRSALLDRGPSLITPYDSWNHGICRVTLGEFLEAL